MKEISLESEAGFKALFEYATLAILVVSRDGHIELINPSAEKLFGYSSAELISQSLEILIPRNLREKHVDHREKYFARPKARPMGLGIDLFAQKKDGHVFPVEISLGYYQLFGEMLAVAFVTDITERKQMERELKEANESLEKKVIERTFELTEALEREKGLNEMKSRFVSMASHEFRTPLSAVLSSISLVETYQDPEHEEKRKKHIERVKSSVRNLTDILNNFLSLDRLEQGKIEAESLRFDLGEFMDEIIEEMDSMLKKKNQKIIYLHTGQREIILDKKILRNIMFNLLSNAIKYSPDEREICVSVNMENDHAYIAVKDSGIGIPEHEQKNLFKNFFRANNTVNIQGTGLGLSIVKKYVELLNGTINFESKPGSGTVFTVEFPEMENKMANVLLIEDNLEIRENTTEILELEGYIVDVAENGIIGIAMAKEKLPDIILCDIMMPEADGWEVIKQVKENKTTAKIPFVFITASVEKKEIQAGLDMGAAGYVRKPFEGNELLTTVEACLKKRIQPEP